LKNGPGSQAVRREGPLRKEMDLQIRGVSLGVQGENKNSTLKPLGPEMTGWGKNRRPSHHRPTKVKRTWKVRKKAKQHHRAAVGDSTRVKPRPTGHVKKNRTQEGRDTQKATRSDGGSESPGTQIKLGILVIPIMRETQTKLGLGLDKSMRTTATNRPRCPAGNWFRQSAINLQKTTTPSLKPQMIFQGSWRK